MPSVSSLSPAICSSFPLPKLQTSRERAQEGSLLASGKAHASDGFSHPFKSVPNITHQDKVEVVATETKAVRQSGLPWATYRKCSAECSNPRSVQERPESDLRSRGESSCCPGGRSLPLQGQCRDQAKQRGFNSLASPASRKILVAVWRLLRGRNVSLSSANTGKFRGQKLTNRSDPSYSSAWCFALPLAVRVLGNRRKAARARGQEIASGYPPSTPRHRRYRASQARGCSRSTCGSQPPWH